MGSLGMAEAATLKVVGLFKNKVVIMLDGKTQILKVGESTKSGLKLVKSSSKGAIFEYRGKRIEYGLTNQIKASLAAEEEETIEESQLQEEPPSSIREVITAVDGAWMTNAVVNGLSIPVELSLEGHTLLSSAVAESLEIPYKLLGVELLRSAPKQTLDEYMANQYKIILDEVKIGGIHMRNIEAIIIEGNEPEITKIGKTWFKYAKTETSEDGSELTIYGQ